MNFQDILSIAGAVFLSIGGGSVVVFLLAKWLGGVWAARILESDRQAGIREHELLVRRRNIYAKLSVSLRVFLSASTQQSPKYQKRFLEAYDEAALWATDEVMSAVGTLLDLIKNNSKLPSSVSEATLQTAYAACIEAMRKDSGFPSTDFQYRVVVF